MTEFDWNSYQTAAGRTLIAAPVHEIAIGDRAVVLAVNRLAMIAARLSAMCETENTPIMQVWNMTGLVGETGELVDLVKKDVFHQHTITAETYQEEVGDALWYVAAGCTVEGYSMADVANKVPSGSRFYNGLALYFKTLGSFADLVGVDLEKAAQGNNKKLLKRFPNGFNSEDSKSRVDKLVR